MTAARHPMSSPATRLSPTLALAIALALALLLAPAGFPVPAPAAVVPGEGVPSPADAFAIPMPGRVFTFPRDHGSHPEFRIEWWYVTGHLRDAAGNRFGFQATFFRTAGPPDPGPASPPPGAAFGRDQLFLSHVALLDVATGAFRHQELLNREGWAAGALTQSPSVWNGASSLSPEPDTPAPASTPATNAPRLRLKARIRAEASWDLQLTPQKPLVVFGRDGVSRKGAPPSAASHYLTFPRLAVSGRLELDGASRAVTGIAWMDHEFSSSQLAPGQAGWDWVSVQLLDGRELMAYRLRHQDGTTDPFSTLAWIEPDGRVTHQSADTFTLEPRAHWQSPRSGARYPLGLRLRARDPVDGRERTFELVPLAEDQELPGRIGNVPYWEGACRVTSPGGEEIGAAFIELTGYAGDLGQRLR